MASQLDTRLPPLESRTLAPDFADRLERSLEIADRERARRQWVRRLRRLLPLCLLVGPIVGWHLMLIIPGGVHTYVDSLAWLTFLLDVGVHGDTAVLSFLGLQALPSIVGFLLLVLLTVTLLGGQNRQSR